MSTQPFEWLVVKPTGWIPLMLSADVPHLEPDHHRMPGGAIRVPGDFQEAAAQEKHDARIVGRAELPVDRQAQHLAVEVAAHGQVGRPQQDPAGQHLHDRILAGDTRGSAGWP